MPQMNDDPGKPEKIRRPNLPQRRRASRGMELLPVLLLIAGLVFVCLRFFFGFNLFEDGRLQIGTSPTATMAARILGIATLIALVMVLVGTQQRRRRRRAMLPEDDTSEPITCAACGAEIASGEYRCASCGWTYRDKE